MKAKYQIYTWEGKYKTAPPVDWLDFSTASLGVLLNPQGIAYIVFVGEACDIRFMYNGTLHCCKLKGEVTRRAAVRYANKFIQEIIERS